MRVLVACEFSGTVRDAFIRAGHEAISCDLLPTEAPGPHYQGDVRDILHDDWDLVVAHPPCTYLCNSGVRWLHEKPGRWGDMRAAAAFFRQFLEAPLARVAVENPVMHGHARALIGRGPDQTVQPWWFGDAKLKATCWWLKGLPKLTPTDKLTPPKDPAERRRWAECHQASPGPDRWKLRSGFYPGMAAALPAQWGAVV